MSTRSNITVVLRNEDLGRQLVFDPALVRHPFIIPAYNAGYYRDAFQYKDMASFTVPSVLAPSEPHAALCSYCQNDGYLEGVGASLLEDFPDYRSALNLVLIGDTECIMTVDNIHAPGNGYDAGLLPSPRRHPERFPHIEYSDHDPENDFGGADFHYLFEDGRWKVRTKDVNRYFNDIMADNPDIHIPFFPVTKKGWTDLRIALDRYRKHALRYRVVSDSESEVSFHAAFIKREDADQWAGAVVHRHDGKPYRVIAHVNSQPDGDTLCTYENHPNPCDAEFPLKIVYTVPAEQGRATRTVLFDDNGGRGYDRIQGRQALLSLLAAINGQAYNGWDDACERTRDIDWLAQVLPDNTIGKGLSAFTVPAINYYKNLFFTLAPLSEEVQGLDIAQFLRDCHADFDDVRHEDKQIVIPVSWGDWKHSHIYLDKLMSLLGYDKDNEMTTEEDGSDTYSADHYYSPKK